MEVSTLAYTSASWTQGPKGFLSTAPHTGGQWESHGCWIFFLPEPESGFLADCNEWSVKVIYCFHVGKPRIFQVWMNALWVVQHPCNLSGVNAELPRWIEPTYCLIYLDDMIIFPELSRSICNACMSCSNAFWNITWNSSQVNANSSTRSTI